MWILLTPMTSEGKRVKIKFRELGTRSIHRPRSGEDDGGNEELTESPKHWAWYISFRIAKCSKTSQATKEHFGDH